MNLEKWVAISSLASATIGGVVGILFLCFILNAIFKKIRKIDTTGQRALIVVLAIIIAILIYTFGAVSIGESTMYIFQGIFAYSVGAIVALFVFVFKKKF